MAALSQPGGAVRPRPRMRGVLHHYAFSLSLLAGAVLVATTSGALPRLVAALFAASVTLMFGMSALYHRVTWSPRWRRVLCRLDHAAIYGLIAATYTPFGLFVLTGAWRTVVLGIVWSSTLAAVLLKTVWVAAPKWLAALVAVLIGWVGVVAFSQLVQHGLGVPGAILLAAGGVFYTVGALVYARRRPDPAPAVFGYHEVFHALVIAAATCHYAAVMLVLSPR